MILVERERSGAGDQPGYMIRICLKIKESKIIQAKMTQNMFFNTFLSLNVSHNDSIFELQFVTFD